MDPNNEGKVQAIIKEANDFCKSHLVYGAIVRDVLDIWDAYIELLDLADPDWYEKWTIEKDKLLSPNSPLDMADAFLRRIGRRKAARTAS